MAIRRVSLLRRMWNTFRFGRLTLRERAVPFLPPEQIQRIQQRRLRAILRHAFETVPFYRQIAHERRLRVEDFSTAADLAMLPLVDGVFVAQNGPLFASTRYDDSSRLELVTSGTSHVCKRIYWDCDSIRYRVAINGRDQVVVSRLLGRRWGWTQLVLIGRTSSIYEVLGFWNAHTLRPPGPARRHLANVEDPLDETLGRINALRPDAVYSYGSYADELFRYIQDRHLRIALPRIWIYGGDMLSEAGRELIENTFGCTVCSTYHATETGRIGFQCERREGFHLNIDYCPVRVVDESGRTAEPGLPGEVVVSNLYNRAMVLLNYRLGDRAVLAGKPCPCGRHLPTLEILQGRMLDMIQVPGRRILAGTVERSCTEELRRTLQAQIVQLGPGRFLWRVVPCSTADRQQLSRGLQEKTRVLVDPSAAVSVEFVERIPRTSGGKLQRVVVKMDPQASAPCLRQ